MTNSELHFCPSHFTQRVSTCPVTGENTSLFGSQIMLHTGAHRRKYTPMHMSTYLGLKMGHECCKRKGTVLHLWSAAATSHSHPTYRQRDIHSTFSSLLWFSRSAQQHFLASTSHTLFRLTSTLAACDWATVRMMKVWWTILSLFS